MTHEWKSRQLDFVLAYPQADVKDAKSIRAQQWQGLTLSHTQTDKKHI